MFFPECPVTVFFRGERLALSGHVDLGADFCSFVL
jgi:hypothetical protein